MADTIETFVAKLQNEGVQAGQHEAEKIRSEADQQAQEIVDQARKQADKIIADAQVQAESLLAKSKTELKLACRDSIMTLRETIMRAIQAVLVGPGDEQLNDPDLLSRILHDMVTQYAQADSSHSSDIIINLQPETLKELADWVIIKLRKTAENNDARIDIKGSLKKSGFEYRVEGATVEVTTDSIVQTLASMINPELNKILEHAINNETQMV